MDFTRPLGMRMLFTGTVVRAYQADITVLSDVALQKRMRKSPNWLNALCIFLFTNMGLPYLIYYCRYVRLMP